MRHRPSRPRRVLATLAPVALLLAACSPAGDGAADASGAASASGSTCEPGELPTLEKGTLTIGTDSPAYEPWFIGNDPSNGQGFESAVAYAVAERLGFSHDDVTWVTVPFGSSYAPGEKGFDFDINQVSITPERAEAVDFSQGYYRAAQAVVSLEGSPLAGVTSVADLAGHRLGAQTGTTSLAAVRDVIRPEEDPVVFEDTGAAKQSLRSGRVDGILADLPTALYISAVEIPGSTIVGQFQPETGGQEEFGLLLEKGSDLTPCVDEALAELREDGTLAEIEREWLSDIVDVPELR